MMKSFILIALALTTALRAQAQKEARPMISAQKEGASSASSIRKVFVATPEFHFGAAPGGCSLEEDAEYAGTFNCACVTYSVTPNELAQGASGECNDFRAPVGRRLEGPHFEGALLAGASLGGAELDGSFFTGAKLNGAVLKGAWLEGADLRHADLEGANLADAHLKGALLAGAIFDERVVLRLADLSGADLRGANLSGVDLTQANLNDADLEGVGLKGATLEGANFAGAIYDDPALLPFSEAEAAARGMVKDAAPGTSVRRQ